MNPVNLDLDVPPVAMSVESVQPTSLVCEMYLTPTSMTFDEIYGQLKGSRTFYVEFFRIIGCMDACNLLLNKFINFEFGDVDDPDDLGVGE